MSFNKQVQVPTDVLVRIVDGEAVLLNLKTEFYYGLDDVSTEFWKTIGDSATLEDAVTALQEVFDVDEARLRADFGTFVDDLVENGLLEYTDTAADSS